MMKDDRLGVLRAPIFVENINAVFGGNETHGDGPLALDLVMTPWQRLYTSACSGINRLELHASSLA
jgi:hypothetical protein